MLANGNFSFLNHTIPVAIPIRINKTVHTGPNIQLGGLNTGLFNVVYQVPTELEVAMLPNDPTTRQRMTDIITRVWSFFFMSSL